MAFDYLVHAHAAVMRDSARSERATPAILRDSFTNGTPELAWHPYPYFNKDNLKGAIDPSSPEGEPGVAFSITAPRAALLRCPTWTRSP